MSESYGFGYPRPKVTPRSEEEVGVFHCSRHNSQPFTNCCRLAITDRETRCPRCRALVIPARVRFSYAHRRPTR